MGHCAAQSIKLRRTQNTGNVEGAVIVPQWPPPPPLGKAAPTNKLVPPLLSLSIQMRLLLRLLSAVRLVRTLRRGGRRRGRRKKHSSPPPPLVRLGGPNKDTQHSDKWRRRRRRICSWRLCSLRLCLSGRRRGDSLPPPPAETVKSWRVFERLAKSRNELAPPLPIAAAADCSCGDGGGGQCAQANTLRPTGSGNETSNLIHRSRLRRRSII